MDKDSVSQWIVRDVVWPVLSLDHTLMQQLDQMNDEDNPLPQGMQDFVEVDAPVVFFSEDELDDEDDDDW